jgi:hypothetical protein
MANQNPTGDGTSVALTIAADQACFLRCLFEAAKAGVGAELNVGPAPPLSPAILHREEAVYGRLQVALESGVIAADDDLRDVISDLARTLDADNEYERIAAEHAVLWGLVDQVGAESPGR